MNGDTIATRRAALRLGGTGLLTAGAVAVLGGCSSMAMAQTAGGKMMASSGDVDILNVALSLEHEAIEAYQIGAESGLLQKPVLDVAVLFQSHHKGHRDALMSTIKTLDGTAVMPKSRDEYVKALNVASIKGQGDILKLAQRLERGAANAYIGVIPSFKDTALAKVSARLAADETMHWTALTQALGEALPAQPLSIGA
jgi:Ferritin-like domain